MPLTRRCVATFAASVLCQPGLSWGQSEKPIRLAVGYAAGGPVDSMARIFAPLLARELGQSVLVENKPGASGALAGELTVTGPADGTAIFFAASPTITIVPHIQKKLRYDPLKDLTPVAPMLTYANVLVVGKDHPARTLEELLASARAQPGKVFYGSAGVGASNHLSGELLAAQAKVQMVHVPYKGNAPAMNDVIGGQLTMMFDIVGGARKYITAGQVRALAVTSATRNPMLPDVPTMREAGMPGYEVVGWMGLFGPKSMAPGVAARLADATRKVLASAEMQTRLADLGYSAWAGSGDQLAAHARKEFDMWSTVTKGIEIE